MIFPRTACLFLAVAFSLTSGCSKSGSGPTDSGTTGGPPPGSVLEVEPNDGTPQPLRALDATDIIVSGTSANENDVDKYSVTLNAPANLFAKVSWQGSRDIDLWILLPNNIPLTIRDTGGNPESCVLTAQAAGTYIIQISSKQSSPTAYVLTLGLR
jgi:hypothetical protein